MKYAVTAHAILRSRRIRATGLAASEIKRLAEGCVPAGPDLSRAVKAWFSNSDEPRESSAEVIVSEEEDAAMLVLRTSSDRTRIISITTLTRVRNRHVTAETVRDAILGRRPPQGEGG